MPQIKNWLKIDDNYYVHKTKGTKLFIGKLDNYIYLSANKSNIKNLLARKYSKKEAHDYAIRWMEMHPKGIFSNFFFQNNYNDNQG